MPSHHHSSLADFFRVFIALTGILTAAQIEAVPIIHNNPIIQNNPTSQTLIRGASTQFNVVATGSGTLSYQWQKDGIDIPGATSSSFSLASAQPWHIGDYRVKITNPAGTVTSQVATLTLNGVVSDLWRGMIGFWQFNGNLNDSGLLQKHMNGNQNSFAVDKKGCRVLQ